MSLELIIPKIISGGFGLLGLSFLVGIHELGHFLFCKLFNVRTPSFSIGFGPKLFSKKIGETEFSFSAIPLGGYVEIAGMQEVGQGDQQEALRSDEQSFSAKPYYQKLLILLGGIGVNLLFAYGALVILFALYGMPATPFLAPRTATNVVESVIANSPAEVVGIQRGDVLLSIDHHSINVTQGMALFFEVLKSKAGQTISLELQRGGISEEKMVSLSPAGKGVILGVTLSSQAVAPLSWKEALRESIMRVNAWISGTFQSLVSMVRHRSINGLGGPISVIHGIASNVHQGIGLSVVILAFISVGLACLNVVPLPIFDGGQVLFYMIEALTGWSLDRIRLYIHYVSWVAVVGLMLYLSWFDLVRIILGK